MTNSVPRIIWEAEDGTIVSKLVVLDTNDNMWNIVINTVYPEEKKIEICKEEEKIEGYSEMIELKCCTKLYQLKEEFVKFCNQFHLFLNYPDGLLDIGHNTDVILYSKVDRDVFLAKTHEQAQSLYRRMILKKRKREENIEEREEQYQSKRQKTD